MTAMAEEEAFPLHLLVWNNQYLELDLELQKKEVSRGVRKGREGGRWWGGFVSGG